MIGVACVYVTAWGWLPWFPARLRRWVALRALRTVMAAQGASIDAFGDDAVERGAKSLASVVVKPSLLMAHSLRDLIVDEDSA